MILAPDVKTVDCLRARSAKMLCLMGWNLKVAKLVFSSFYLDYLKSKLVFSSSYLGYLKYQTNHPFFAIISVPWRPPTP